MKKKKLLKDLKPYVWEHPEDKAAFIKLTKVFGLNKVVRTFLEGSTERSLRLAHLASSVKVSNKQFPHIHKLFGEVCKTFCVTNIPEIYISQTPFLNSGVIGIENPFIVIKASDLELFTDDDELTFLLGYELGQILSGHTMYKTLLDLLLKMSEYLLNIPLSGVVLTGVLAALKEYFAKAQWSADRAGLLAVQNPDVATRVLMKLSGGGLIQEMDFSEILKQADEYKKGQSLSGNLFKLINILGQTQSFAIIRLEELVKWVTSGEYTNILEGNYEKKQPLLGQDVDRQVEENHEEESSTKSTNEYLNKTLKQAEDTIQNTSKKAKEMFDKWFQTPPD
jgi:Zn-dependent protease with chaperone function